MDYVRIKVESFNTLIALIKTTYYDKLVSAYNWRLKEQKNILYSSVESPSVPEDDLNIWLRD